MLKHIAGERGFHVASLADFELACIRALITDQYLNRIAELQPELLDEASARGIAQYHALPIAFDHAKAWPKECRLLNPTFAPLFTGMRFFQRIRRQTGPSVVISRGELNWRLVRPDAPTDVGPIHADGWFWDAGYGTMPAGFDRFKVWMAIHSEPGANGLSIKPGSHQRDWRHHFEERDGARKPVFDEDPAAMHMELLPLAAGQIVMFHDRLLHGGAVNRGRRTRVSLELTVLYDRAEAAALLQTAA